MKLSSNLVGKTSEQIKSIAQNIASETFIKNGNKAVSFTENVELRCLVGGRYQSYPELSKFVIAAYNEMTATLIIANL